MSKVRFSGASRAADLLAMASETLDLLVIGGGITGAGIAWDAAMRGLRVALIEQRDFAFGTSSRSTKLIHGGLRYLAQGEVGLVREVGRERAVLHRLAPHLVHPMKLLLPLYKKGPYGRLSTSVGLWMYDRLAGVSHSERRVMLSKKQTLQRELGLRQEGLIGGGMYVEYRTDDSRLTLEVLKTANFAGALLANYAQATRLLYNERGAVCGADVQDLVAGRTLTVKARRVVNATGPWVDLVRRMDGDSSGKRLHLTKGVHVTVKATDLPVTHALYIGADDGRMVFVIPRGTRTYIGTTDTDYDGALEHPTCRAEDVEYLLRTVNAHFPGAHLHPEHVTSSWAGLRPLLHEEGKSPSELSRKEEIFCSPSGLYSVAGGKLTGFRTMAEKVVDLVVDDLKTGLDGAPFAACSTGVTPLSGGDVG
ncbi:MAG: glycerol-3-phosphate dehydrogenase/oxidase, partial [Tumebacillaceae bacterium]